MPGALPVLPSLSDQVDRLVELGAHEIGGLSAAGLRAAALGTESGNALLVVHPDRAPASALAPLLEHGGKPGFIVADMTDVDQFSPIESALPPAGPLYLVADLHRGDEMANWSPGEALPAITAAMRTPLTLGEGLHWLLQQPEVLERNHCFMTIGSRLRKANGALDSRTPALWISNGTGRDGAGNRNAPKVGWCWAGNRHSWLGFASAACRIPSTAPAPARPPAGAAAFRPPSSYPPRAPPKTAASWNNSSELTAASSQTSRPAWPSSVRSSRVRPPLFSPH